jgi:predicted NBD/HSP70 family sugar kinase
MRKSGINLEQVKRENRSLILKCVNDHGPISRKDIAKVTGLTAASVTQITTSLIAENELIELGAISENAGTAGRKKILLDLNQEYGYVLAINIEAKTTTVAVCDIKGNIMGDGQLISTFDTDGSADPADFLEVVIIKANSLIKKLPGKKSKLLKCVSIGIPGIVDKERGVSVHAYGIWDKEVNIRGFFEKAYQIPILIENNVDAFATAEIIYGTGKRFDSLLVIKWGPGIGSTIVIDNKVYEGRHGKTAELGHVIVEKNGIKCSCGKRGCLETILSASALSKIKSKEKLDYSLDLFAKSIVNTCSIIAPNRIILAGPLFADKSMRDKIISFCREYDPSCDESKILYTSLSGKESYIGPVAVYFSGLVMCSN